MKLKTNFSSFRFFLLAVFLIGLFYILLPGPGSIGDFPPLPGSVKSNLEGDTIQNPNISAYFSDYNRAFITNYYKSIFTGKLLFGLIPATRINHPPEEAYRYVRDQQESTFLEEYVFPLRESIFVNGYEPFIENEIYHAPHSPYGDRVEYQKNWYLSKTTLRFYPSNIFFRIFVYLGIWVSCYLLYKLSKKVFYE